MIWNAGPLSSFHPSLHSSLSLSSMPACLYLPLNTLSFLRSSAAAACSHSDTLWHTRTHTDAAQIDGGKGRLDGAYRYGCWLICCLLGHKTETALFFFSTVHAFKQTATGSACLWHARPFAFFALADWSWIYGCKSAVRAVQELASICAWLNID